MLRECGTVSRIAGQSRKIRDSWQLWNLKIPDTVGTHGSYIAIYYTLIACACQSGHVQERVCACVFHVI